MIIERKIYLNNDWLQIRCPNMDILQLVGRRVCLVSEFDIFLNQLFLYTSILDR